MLKCHVSSVQRLDGNMHHARQLVCLQIHLWLCKLCGRQRIEIVGAYAARWGGGAQWGTCTVSTFDSSLGLLTGCFALQRGHSKLQLTDLSALFHCVSIKLFPVVEKHMFFIRIRVVHLGALVRIFVAACGSWQYLQVAYGPLALHCHQACIMLRCCVCLC